ncbi:hypothetical protein CJU90_4453 [Yarrowia sp. C11]|nr:hypothetical protein CKK34_6734 [Yarrowia sp. E02]KAG5365375.1 hypothetical protein CJU90_4453 [Yarrowia sp. C11]
MPSPIFLSRPPPNFSPLAIVRGFQLFFVGAYRSLQNPDIFRTQHYKKALKMLGYSLGIQLLLWSPILVLKWFLHLSKLAFTGQEARFTINDALSSLRFIQNSVLNLGPFVIAGMRYFRPEIDEIFLRSLQHADQTYAKNHPENKHPPQYYMPLITYKEQARAYGTGKGGRSWWSFLSAKTSNGNDFSSFLSRMATRTAFTLAMYLIKDVPVLGSLSISSASFYSFNQVVGTPAAAAVFGLGLMVPKKWLLVFLSAFWGSRSLVRELLIPYFKRIPFTTTDRQHWLAAREGVIFGFGAGFFLLLRIPYVGLLTYGIAEASTAYLITKISDPPPHPSQFMPWSEREVAWTFDDSELMSDEPSKQARADAAAAAASRPAGVPGVPGAFKASSASKPAHPQLPPRPPAYHRQNSL